MKPLIRFIELAWLALVFAFQLIRPHHQLRPPVEFDLGWLYVEQFIAAQRQQHKLLIFVILLDVLDRARRLRVDRPCDVRRPFGRARR